MFSESSVYQIYFELASIVKNQSWYFLVFTVCKQAGDVFGFVSRINDRYNTSPVIPLILFPDNGRFT